jgi:glycosyltransferase involved in cell wall biosynthesis
MLLSDGKPPIVAITDHVGANPTNGAQVFADALLLQLAQWFDVTILAAPADHPPDFLASKVAIVPVAEDGTPEISSALMHQLRLDSAGLLYNLGATTFSCRVTEALHRLVPRVPLVNHFQVLLDVYAKHEGWSEEEATRLAESQRAVAGVAERNLFPSFSELSTAMFRWNLTNSNNFVVPNAFIGVDLAERPSTDGRQFTFLAAGRFADYAKGADLLYRAFVELRRQHPTIRLEIATADERFLEILKPLPSDAWTLLGWLDRTDLLGLMRTADVVVVPSRYEPFGLVAVEAMAMGTPVIAMAVGGLAEIVCHGLTGWLCPPEEGSLGLRLMMDKAVRSHDRVLAMAADAQELVNREYSLSRVAKMIRVHLENAMAAQGNASFNSLLVVDEERFPVETERILMRRS